MREGFVHLGRRKTWYRTHGERTDRPPLLMLHGGPGGASPNDVPFVDVVARDRLVVEYDQLETGRSQRLGEGSALTVEGHIDELTAVRAALGLDDVHLWGASWGGMLAMAYALTRPSGLRSVISASGPHSVPLWLAAATELRSQLPPHNLRALERCEATLVEQGPKPFKAGDGPSSAKVTRGAKLLASLVGPASRAPVQAALRAASRVPQLRAVVYPALGLEFVRRHVIRLPRIPVGALAGMVAMNAAVYEHMWGPSEHFATGPLRDFDLTGRLHEIDVPMLVTSGAHEILRPDHVAALVARVPDVHWELFEHSAHSAPYEEPERYADVLREFLTKVDGRRPAALAT